MNRETKFGLITGLLLIVAIGMLISRYLSSRTAPVIQTPNLQSLGGKFPQANYLSCRDGAYSTGIAIPSTRTKSDHSSIRSGRGVAHQISAASRCYFSGNAALLPGGHDGTNFGPGARDQCNGFSCKQCQSTDGQRQPENIKTVYG